jgi:Protein of unknown function (DUF2950)
MSTNLARPVIVACVAIAALISSHLIARDAQQRTFASPEEAVAALVAAVKGGHLNDVVALFGPGGQELANSSDAATGRRHREVFVAAAAEGWRLQDEPGKGKVLILGREAWPFPVPLVKRAAGWQFDTAAGKEEVLARRIGRNELAVIGVCRRYVAAQRLYSQHPHDGKPTGLFAQRIASSPGKQDGLYWPPERGQKHSPLGDLVALAAEEGRPLNTGLPAPQPFHGYAFRILTGQGTSAAGGAKSYLVSGDMAAGFALVAWPVQYDATGVMTFVVNQEGVVYQKDLGPSTAATAGAMTVYDPGTGWEVAQ